MALLKEIYDRIDRKKNDYQEYDFSRRENDALKTFFDLAQEFGTIEDFYLLCVAIPKSFFNLEACLYLVDPKLNGLTLVSTTDESKVCDYSSPPPDLRPGEHAIYTDRNSLVLTIRGKKPLMDQLPFHIEDDVIGFLEVSPAEKLHEHNELFFEKYANRIGFRMHNKFLMERNIEHLRFIRTLVADIEHNIIVPNMVYKLFLRSLKRKIQNNLEIEQYLAEFISQHGLEKSELEGLAKELSEVNKGLFGELENIEKHYKNMSLFIETLFRKSHFDQGKLTLRTKSCNMKKDIVQPQLERYIEQLRKEGIEIDDRLSGIPDEETVNVVDVGLIAQVYANLFSNALKYTKEVNIFGETKKFIAYGHEVLRDFFGHGKDGVKYNVFSSGPHIPEEERSRLFDEEYRASNAKDRPGTGHGLAFIKNVVEIHGGVTGYEITAFGNNFYFILPR